MEGRSKYAAVVLALLAGFALFCFGRFSAQLSAAGPWQVTAESRPSPAAAVSEETGGERAYPDSLLPGERIDINTADLYDLQRLPGIGEKRAQDILAWREEHGPFQSVDELTEVYGIGPGILEGLRDYVTTGSE